MLKNRQNSKIQPMCYPLFLFKHKRNPTSYVATKANSALKSDAPLFKTAQSVSVVTREQLDQNKQEL